MKTNQLWLKRWWLRVCAGLLAIALTGSTETWLFWRMGTGTGYSLKLKETSIPCPLPCDYGGLP